ncbi:sugar ABC transporter permease [Gracilibacillus sp. YIM 98692]|uniref:carbohydrate ABC transporter permease n=1 Tax=Gracilibacillus sp. YIM 98692 TaxID=2663532 RepID=UPI0013D78F70|nr:sugar ABC transporter permease [Gracilibacillus sp. YIM 98692]
MKSKWNSIVPYILISPYAIIYLVFVLIPLIWVFYLSFTNQNIFSAGEWIGIGNYQKAFSDNAFLLSIRNTSFYWLFTVLPSMIIGLVLAVFMNTKIKLAPVFRAIIYLPAVMSGVAVSMTWIWLYSPIGGPIYSFLQSFGLSSKDLLKDPATALPAVIVVGIWISIGFSMIIYTAGLQGIPNELYEAASIDGATSIRKFFQITIPLLRPITFFIFIMTTIASFQVFDIVYVMTGGGPANRTTTIVNEIVRRGFEDFEMGYAATLAIFLLIIVFVFTLVNYIFTPKENDLN